MKKQPTLKTGRLILRPFIMSDSARVKQIAGQKSISGLTLNIPHPYTEDIAKEWITNQPKDFAEDKAVVFAITLDKQHIIGAISLKLSMPHKRGEIGYWLDPDQWGKGYMTEAGRAIIIYGFETLGLNKIYGECMPKNPASGRVMEKIGMTEEALLRKHYIKNNKPIDVVVYAILKQHFKQ